MKPINLCVTTRDQLMLVRLDLVAYVKADNNTVDIQYITGGKQTLNIKMWQFIELMKKALPNCPTPFHRMGRSLVVNFNYLSELDKASRQLLVLSDRGSNKFQLKPPKDSLKEVKQVITDYYRSRIGK